MVSKRQQIARKRFKEAHPDLFPPPPPPDPSKKNKNKKSNFKRKKSDHSNPDNVKKSSGKKHPLRIAGMKPGESCFICRAPDHIAKNCSMKSEWERNKICLSCRQRGHSLKNCPNKSEESANTKLCYNCGETGHSLANCSQPVQDGGTKYASCFICNETGHLSKDCPKNTHGIYPKGGSCKLCGGITHLARDCPNKRMRIDSAGTVGPSCKCSQSNAPRERFNRITKFSSGDDLEDDFVPVVTLAGKDGSMKTKKREGPKVVEFVG